MGTNSHTLTRKLPFRRGLPAALLLALMLLPTALSIHALDHQFAQTADDCALCLASPQLDHAVPIGAFAQARVTLQTIERISSVSLTDGSPLVLPPARAPPRA